MLCTLRAPAHVVASRHRPAEEASSQSRKGQLLQANALRGARALRAAVARAPCRWVARGRCRAAVRAAVADQSSLSSAATGGPQFPPTIPIEGPAAWYGRDMAAHPERWIYELTESDIDELGEISYRLQGQDLATVRRSQCIIKGDLADSIDRIREDLIRGVGFCLVRGLPVEEWGVARSAAAYWALGLAFGEPVPQNKKGHLLGHVKDIGGDPSKPETRLYTTNAAQPYHTDSADLVGLLCLKTAMEGGDSNVTSSVTVFNEVAKRRPDLVPVLLSDFYNDRKGEVPEGKDPWWRMPVFCWHDGALSSMHDRSFINAAQARFPELPRLTAAQREALDLCDSVAAEEGVRLDMTLRPGDMQFIHNHQIWHARTAFRDWPEPDRRRHLLRLWLSIPDGIELPAVFAERYGNIERWTIRGGIRVPGATQYAPLEAE